MKKIFVTIQLIILITSVFILSGNASVPPTKIDIYPTDFTGTPIPNKVFTISPAMPNGATTIVGDAVKARIYVGGCGTSPSSPPCVNKGVNYTIDGGTCFNRLYIKFLKAYSWTDEPGILFSERYDGNEGFQVSGGANFTFSLLPMTSQYPCG